MTIRRFMLHALAVSLIMFFFISWATAVDTTMSASGLGGSAGISSGYKAGLDSSVSDQKTASIGSGVGISQSLYVKSGAASIDKVLSATSPSGDFVEVKAFVPVAGYAVWDGWIFYTPDGGVGASEEFTADNALNGYGSGRAVSRYGDKVELEAVMSSSSQNGQMSYSNTVHGGLDGAIGWQNFAGSGDMMSSAWSANDRRGDSSAGTFEVNNGQISSYSQAYAEGYGASTRAKLTDVSGEHARIDWSANGQKGDGVGSFIEFDLSSIAGIEYIARAMRYSASMTASIKEAKVNIVMSPGAAGTPTDVAEPGIKMSAGARSAQKDKVDETGFDLTLQGFISNLQYQASSGSKTYSAYKPSTPSFAAILGMEEPGAMRGFSGGRLLIAYGAGDRLGNGAGGNFLVEGGGVDVFKLGGTAAQGDVKIESSLGQKGAVGAMVSAGMGSKSACGSETGSMTSITNGRMNYESAAGATMSSAYSSKSVEVDAEGIDSVMTADDTSKNHVSLQEKTAGWLVVTSGSSGSSEAPTFIPTTYLLFTDSVKSEASKASGSQIIADSAGAFTINGGAGTALKATSSKKRDSAVVVGPSQYNFVSRYEANAFGVSGMTSEATVYADNSGASASHQLEAGSEFGQIYVWGQAGKNYQAGDEMGLMKDYIAYQCLNTIDGSYLFSTMSLQSIAAGSSASQRAQASGTTINRWGGAAYTYDPVSSKYVGEAGVNIDINGEGSTLNVDLTSTAKAAEAKLTTNKLEAVGKAITRKCFAKNADSNVWINVDIDGGDGTGTLTDKAGYYAQSTSKQSIAAGTWSGTGARIEKNGFAHGNSAKKDATVNKVWPPGVPTNIKDEVKATKTSASAK